MLILNQGFFNLLIYLTENCREVKCSDQKTLLKQSAELYFSRSITVREIIMGATSNHLFVDKSSIPAAGSGLFTSVDIEKGQLVIEYTGEITTWEEVRHDADNLYIYFVNDDYVINAQEHPEAIARYANDAHGLTRVPGLHNNSRFVNIGGKIFIKAAKLIKAGSEILVDYGKSYWETVKKNKELFNKK
jgi:SET domain-containing protein